LTIEQPLFLPTTNSCGSPLAVQELSSISILRGVPVEPCEQTAQRWPVRSSAHGCCRPRGMYEHCASWWTCTVRSPTCSNRSPAFASAPGVQLAALLRAGAVLHLRRAHRHSDAGSWGSCLTMNGRIAKPPPAFATAAITNRAAQPFTQDRLASTAPSG
jgi:hypothetical protein